MPASYLVRAARRARMEAELLAEAGDAGAADFLWKEIHSAETLLKRASARMRLAIRPRSVSGFGENLDRLRDTVDRMHLDAELHDEDDLEDDDDEGMVDLGDASDSTDDDWQEFVDGHPGELTRADWDANQARLQAERDAWKREQAEGAAAPLRNVSRETVLAALRALTTATGATQARDVAVALAPSMAPPGTPGRQRVIARVGMILRQLAAEGEAVQIRPTDNHAGRLTCRYAIGGQS